MDYKALIENQDFLTPEQIAGWMLDASYSITDQLARAEAAEALLEKAEKLIDWIYNEACIFVEHNMRQHLDWIDWIKAEIEERRREWKENGKGGISVDINEKLESMVATMKEIGERSAPSNGVNLLLYREQRERLLEAFLGAFESGYRLTKEE